MAAEGADDWPQWGGGPQHQGASASAGAPLDAIKADLVYDPFVPLEKAEARGELVAHYPVPLIDGGDVYMEWKSGRYAPCSPPGSRHPAPCGPDAWNLEVWNVRKLSWQRGSLAPMWSFESDWKPEPNSMGLSGWEPVFQPVLADGFLYVPGAGGTIIRVSKETGAAIARINPFGGSLDANTYVAGGLAADAQGDIIYDAIKLDANNPAGADVAGAWLVKVGADASASRVAFSALVPDAPASSSLCRGTFTNEPLPWPPSADAVPSSSRCGSQRPGLNLVPAVAPDGTIYTVSRAHFNGRFSYLIAARPDLTPLWHRSLRGLLADGCGVLLPPNGTPGGCRDGAATGVDPATNQAPAGQVSDLATSSPVVLPDGSVLYGATARYNYLRGHLFKFGPDGRFLAAYDFGWDVTPAVFGTASSYTIFTKDNHYDVGSYCDSPALCPAEPGRYAVTALDSNLAPLWSFTNTNTESCQRLPDGSLSCVSDHPDGFEWCVNQPAVDARGVVYANSEDGTLYAIAPGGSLEGSIFLDLALGAAYTPLSIGPDGAIYTQNDGHLFVVGLPQAFVPPSAPTPGLPVRVAPRPDH